MEKDPPAEWEHSLPDSLWERWPKDASGSPEEPVFLCRCQNLDLKDDLMVNMLEAYGIPCLRSFPGDGSFGRLILGISGQGVEIFVPKSLYNDAKELCEGENYDEEL